VYLEKDGDLQLVYSEQRDIKNLKSFLALVSSPPVHELTSQAALDTAIASNEVAVVLLTPESAGKAIDEYAAACKTVLLTMKCYRASFAPAGTAAIKIFKDDTSVEYSGEFARGAIADVSPKVWSSWQCLRSLPTIPSPFAWCLVVD
jgi:hypothetical protein